MLWSFVKFRMVKFRMVKFGMLFGCWGLAGLVIACAPRNNPKKSNTRIELAKDFLSKGELEAANREAALALKYDDENAAAYQIMGTVDYLRAVSNIQLLEVDDCLTGVDAEGFRQEFDGNLAKALVNFKKAVHIDSEYSEAYRLMGMVAFHQEDYTKAEALLTEALKVPHRLMSLSLTRADLAWVLFHKGDMASAANELRKSLQFSPKLCVANYRLGRVYYERKEWVKAAERFDSIVNDNLCPMQEAHLYRIKTLSQLNQSIDADDVNSCVHLAQKSCIAAACTLGGQ